MKIITSTILKKKLLVKYRVLFLIFIICVAKVNAQNIKVEGTVTSADNGTPLPGVTILLKGTDRGTTTDFDGKYSINADIGDILVFNYIGFVEKSLKIKNTSMNVTLASDVEALNEVVVIGYGEVKKKELTGAVSSVESDELEKVVTSDLGSALQGQAAGVNVVSSSLPGGDPQILIRGITSLGENTPLYVVDGIVQESDPQIPPSEIASVDILKDAASTAIYGSRGATGVILITTKKGEPGTLQIRSDATYGIQRRNKSIPLMNSVEQTYFNVVTYRNINNGLDENAPLQLLNNPLNFQNETDLNDIIFEENAPTQNYNINLSGGSENLRGNINLGYYQQDGLQLNSAYERFNIRANTTFEKNRWKIQGSVAIFTDERDIPQNFLLSQAVVYNPTQNGIEVNNNQVLDDDNGDDVNRLGWVIESLKTTNVRESIRTQASTRIDYEIIDGLTLTSNLGITNRNEYGKQVRPFQPIFTNTGIPQNSPATSFIEMRALKNNSLVLEGGATYSRQFNDHDITLTAFATYEQYQTDQFSARRQGVTNNDVLVLDGATGDQSVSSGFNYQDRRIGTIGRLQYDYKDKYLLSASVRRDGSSKFNPERQWGTFPSVSLAWNISDESFWKPLKPTFNNAKFRISHGSVGNDRIRAYLFSPSIEQNINYVGFDPAADQEILQLGSTQTTFANELLKWETTTQTNVGLDLGFLKNKLTFSAEYYYTDKEDMLFPVFLPLSAGGGTNARVTLNIGNMTNEGYELTSRFRGEIGELDFSMKGTFATNENIITKINGNDDFLLTDDFGLVGRASNQSRITALAVGREAGAFFLWQTDGIIDTEEKLAEYQQIDNNARMGDVIFRDIDNNGVLNDDDRGYSGSGLPEYEIGYNFEANYKNFDFSMNWYAAIGQEIMNGFNAWAYGFGRHKDQVYQWSEENLVTPVPAFRGDIRRHPNFIGYSDFWLEDGSYLRLRQATFGYKLPKKITENWGISWLRFYVRAQNALTITPYSGYNPEIGGGISSRGLDKDTGPTSALYLTGIQLNF